jgi:hypothetical protein
MTYYQKTYYTNAKKTEYNGIIYDSKLEAGYAQELDLRLKAGEILGWDRQVKLPLIVNGYLIQNYYMDFVVYHEGETEYVELKGYADQAFFHKYRLFEALYTQPGNILTLIMQGKQKPPKLRKAKISSK